MSFLKFSRDRRGYEHFYLVEAVTGRRGKTRQRVLYWFRTPPNVKVGREPFDPQLMRALEAQYPDVRFDWDQIRNTPIPSVEPEYWRERRRADRNVRRLQEEEDALAAAGMPSTPGPGVTPEHGVMEEPGVTEVVLQDLSEQAVSDHGPDTPLEVPNAVDSTGGGLNQARGDAPGSRRRRRRRRGQRNPTAPGPQAAGEPTQTEPVAGASIDASEVTDDGSVEGSGD